MNFISIVIIIIFSSSFLYGDVLITNDGMILNGKVVSKTAEETTFSNYHGTFKIKNRMIKKIHVTEKFEEDVQLFREMGEKIDESDIKRNFQSGLSRKDEVIGSSTGDIEGEIQKQLFHMDCHLSSFFLFNAGVLNDVLPYAFGGSLSSDLFHKKYFFNTENLFMPEFRVEFSYLYSGKDSKRIDGFGLTAGPIWFYLTEIGTYGFNLHLATLFGSGNYNVQSTDVKLRRFSFNMNVILGGAFPLGKIELMPAFRFNYIYDSEAPLIGFGFNLSAGYRFF